MSEIKCTMNDITRSAIRRIFLTHRPHTALQTASLLLEIPFRRLEKEIADGSIVAVRAGIGMRIPHEEMMALAIQRWDQATIEEALGDDAPRVLPEAIRLVELRARIPRYQRDMLHVLAKKRRATVDTVLARELEDVACAHAQEIEEASPGFRNALGWPADR